MVGADKKPILIVGAGPVGLCLALALIRKGVPIALFEKDPELNSDIRASTLHPPTLEMLAEWGVVEHVLKAGYRVDQLKYWERSTKELIASFDYGHISADTQFPFRLQCPQHILTRVLLPIVQAHPLASVYMGHTYLRHSQHEDGVLVVFRNAAGAETIVGGRYLCAADGSRSAVRQHLGLAFDGLTYEDRFLLIGTDYELTQVFPNFGRVNYIFDPKEWVIVLQLPDLARVVFRLREDESAEFAQQLDQLQKRMWGFLGHQDPFNILTLQLYRVHQRVAETFRVGRTLLLGDAAHINNPSGGMGMNSGIHDAYALADAFVAGTTAALDHYSTIRRQNALENVKAHSEKNYADLASTDAAYRQKRNRSYHEMATDPTQAREFLLKASMLAERT